MRVRTPPSNFPTIILSLVLTASLTPFAYAAQNMPVNTSLVHISNFTFTPAEITVAPGTAVTWTNEDDIPHAIAATGKAFRSKALDTGENYSFTFTVPGTYDYFCSLHPHMQGKIIVK
jgi:amicyanin